MLGIRNEGSVLFRAPKPIKSHIPTLRKHCKEKVQRKGEAEDVEECFKMLLSGYDMLIRVINT